MPPGSPRSRIPRRFAGYRPARREPPSAVVLPLTQPTGPATIRPPVRAPIPTVPCTTSRSLFFRRMHFDCRRPWQASIFGAVPVAVP